jgi:hypothetical protein
MVSNKKKDLSVKNNCTKGNALAGLFDEEK